MENMHAQLRRFNLLISEMNAAYHEAALRLGLSDSAMMILYTVCMEGDSCPLSEITRLSGLSKQTIHSALRGLEAQGMASTRTLDGRRKQVCLKEQGRELARRTVWRLIGVENAIFESWSAQEQEQYLSLTKRYLEAFREGVRALP